MKKRIIAFVAIIVIVGIILGAVIWRINNQSNNEGENIQKEDVQIEEIEAEEIPDDDALTETQWMSMLNEELDIEDHNEYSDEKERIREAIISGFEKLPQPIVDYYLIDRDDTDDNRILIAIEQGMVDEKETDYYLSEDVAKVLVKNLNELQNISDYRVEKRIIDLSEGVIDGREWKSDYYSSSNDNAEVILTTDGYQPSIDERIFYTDNNGIYRAGKIEKIESQGGNKYDILLIPADNKKDYIQDYTLAGYVDWTSSLNALDGKSSASNSIITCTTEDNNNSAKDYAFTTNIVIEGSIDPMNDNTLSLEKAQIGDFDIIEWAKSDDEDEEDNESEDDESDDNGNNDDANSSFSANGTGKFTYTIEDLQIYIYAKDDSEVVCEVSYNPEFNLEGDFELSSGISFPKIPIQWAGCTASLGLGIELNTSGSYELTVGLTEPSYSHYSVSLSGANCYENSPEIYIEPIRITEAEMDIGAKATVSCSLIDVVKIASPGFKVSVIAKQKELDLVEGFDVPCSEAKIAGPIIELIITDDNDSLIAYLLTVGQLQSSYSLNSIDADQDIFSKYFHVEISPERRIMEDPLGNAAVCTHHKDGKDHTEDPTILFDEYSERTAEEITSPFIIVINGDEYFGFDFYDKKDEEAYISYLEEITQDSESYSKETNTMLNPLIEEERNIYDMEDEDEEELVSISSGEAYIPTGGNISNMSFFYHAPTGYFTNPQVRGRVVGTIDDTDTYNKLMKALVDKRFNARIYLNPYISEDTELSDY